MLPENYPLFQQIMGEIYERDLPPSNFFLKTNRGIIKQNCLSCYERGGDNYFIGRVQEDLEKEVKSNFSQDVSIAKLLHSSCKLCSKEEEPFCLVAFALDSF